jgi:LuxR family transcriptional regulator, maltose regulon positive regulatory protein
MGYVFTIHADIALFSGDIPRAVSLARRALELLPETEALPRSGAMLVAVYAYLVSGDVNPATEHEVAAAAYISDNPFSMVSSITLLARLYILQGRLRQAAAAYRQEMQTVQQPEVLQTVPSGLLYYFGLGDLLREWNELDKAEQHLVQGMELINETLTLDPVAAMLGYTSLARLQQARGNTTAALTTLDALAQLAEQRHFAPHFTTLPPCGCPSLAHQSRLSASLR